VNRLQLTASKPIDLNTTFDLVPASATGTKRAVMIGINYVGAKQGQLSGCHNDAKNMLEYIKNVHGFEDENIVILLDDVEHEQPTKANILAAYRKLVEESEPGDALFCHYSGHGTLPHESMMTVKRWLIVFSLYLFLIFQDARFVMMTRTKKTMDMMKPCVPSITNKPV
jgi:hypothetical protein